MTRRPPPRRPLRTFLTVMAISLVAGAIIGGTIGVMDAGHLSPTANVVAFLLAFAAAGLVFYACMWWWRSLDEAAQEAHKWAWWWGGSAGMLAGLVGLLLLRALEARGRVSIMDPSAPVGETLYNGAMAILLFQVIGYVIAWAAWWLRHR